MTSAISGQNLALTSMGGATEPRSANVDEHIDALDATSADSSGSREYITGLDNVEFSFECIGTKPSKGSQASVTIDSGGNTWSGAAIITDVGAAIPHDNVVAYSCRGVFNGTVSIS